MRTIQNWITTTKKTLSNTTQKELLKMMQITTMGSYLLIAMIIQQLPMSHANKLVIFLGVGIFIITGYALTVMMHRAVWTQHLEALKEVQHEKRHRHFVEECLTAAHSCTRERLKRGYGETMSWAKTAHPILETVLERVPDEIAKERIQRLMDETCMDWLNMTAEEVAECYLRSGDAAEFGAIVARKLALYEEPKKPKPKELTFADFYKPRR